MMASRFVRPFEGRILLQSFLGKQLHEIYRIRMQQNKNAPLGITEAARFDDSSHRGD
jgi:hypothetical protein